jgi:hypothetical protein
VGADPANPKTNREAANAVGAIATAPKRLRNNFDNKEKLVME